MQSRVVGPMESWRGGVRRVAGGVWVGGKRARGWFSAAWRTGMSTGETGVDRAESGSRPGMSNNGGGEEERIARGTGVKEQISRGAEVRELNSVSEPGRRPGDDPDRRMTVPEQSRVPSWLATASAWAWRLLLLAVVIYLISRVLGILYIVVVPCISALVLGGLVTLVANRVSADYPTLLAEAKHTTAQVQSWLAGPPFHLKNNNVQKFLNNIPSYLSKHKSLVEGTVVTGGKIASEFFGGLVLMVFVLFFLIKDGDRIWNWLLGAMRTDTARRMDRAGHAAWLVLVYYMRGTVIIAAIHAIVVGVALWIMGVPLAVPLAVVVFVAAF